MCIRVCLHRTSLEHDTRFSSMLNPATGYKVRSPFQDPDIDCCNHPCLIQTETFSRGCPYHAGCCDYTEQDICRYGERGRSCNYQVKYHHFLSQGTVFDVGALRIYCVSEPTFLSFAAKFFKAGVELNLALTKCVEIQQLFDEAGKGRSDENLAIRQAALCSRWYHYQYIKLVSAAYLAQFAIYWDTQATKGLWPQRPGREAMPELNLFNPSDDHLKLTSLGKADDGPQAHWPHNFKQWLNFEQLLSFADDPSSIPWFRDQTTGYYQTIADISWTFGISPPLVQTNNPCSLSATNPQQDSPQQRLRSHRHSRKHRYGHRSYSSKGSTNRHHIRRSSTPISSPSSYSSSTTSSPNLDSSSCYPPKPRHRNPSKHNPKRRQRYTSPRSPPASCLKPRPGDYRSNKRVRFESPNHSSTDSNRAYAAVSRWKRRKISSANSPPTGFNDAIKTPVHDRSTQSLLDNIRHKEEQQPNESLKRIPSFQTSVSKANANETLKDETPYSDACDIDWQALFDESIPNGDLFGPVAADPEFSSNEAALLSKTSSQFTSETTPPKDSEPGCRSM
ncbi:hypothetical protein HD806DRAFT_214979 [Xylariaceae sp. AK1471]|nr:hypothetical protein HD806DRAFT_214979 [Xylariaceae sp. AK1471]